MVFAIFRLLFRIWLIIAILVCSISEGTQTVVSSYENMLVIADIVSYDITGSKIIAKDHVEAVHSGQVLMADELEYDQKNNILKAQGKISILKSSGDVIFAKRIVTDHALSKGMIDDFGMRTKINAIIASKQAFFTSNNTISLSKAVYSPCQLCCEDGKHPPIWQIKANRVIVDNKAEIVYYRHASFEVYGFPVFYLPYMFHPVAGAKRKSGLLLPSQKTTSNSDDPVQDTDKTPPEQANLLEGNSRNNLGKGISMPFYWNIAPQMDATITPTIFTRNNPLFMGEFRHLLPQGNYQLSGGITWPRSPSKNNDLVNKAVRYYLQGDGLFMPRDKWYTGFNFKRSSDSTFLKKYDLGSDSLLTSRLWVERIDKKNFFGAESIVYQDLMQDYVFSNTPVIVPYITYHRETKPFYDNIFATIDAKLVDLEKKRGEITDQIMLKPSIIWPMVTAGGHKFEFAALVEQSLFHVAKYNYSPGKKFSGDISRTTPQASSSWSYPMMGNVGKNTMVKLEPKASVIASPYKQDNYKIPVYDSQNMDLSYVNFWRDNHFSGSSRIETGLRTALGVDTAIHNPKLGFLQLFIGQIRSKRQNASFSYESGMSQKLSDYVLNVLWQPLNILDISYKARLSSKKLEHNYDELAFSGHLADTSWGIKYVSLLAYTTQDIVAKLAKYRQLEVNLSQSITKQWKVGGSVSKDLTKRSVIGITSGTRMIYLGGQVIYEGDCVGMVFSIKRDFTHYRDVKADTRWGFAIRLKTLNW